MYSQRYLLLLSVPFVIWLVVFKYLPLGGWLIAFQDFKPHLGFFGQKWVGLKQFRDLFNSPRFYQALKNTLGMSSLSLVLGFTSSIGFAVMLNELRFLPFKRAVQTVSYLPHFVSWVIAANIVTGMLSPTGAVNSLLLSLSLRSTPINFMIKPELFWWIVVLADIWKETGWNAIIYLAAMAGIDSQIYEAAEIDGANRLQKIWFVTLPGIRATIVILLIITVGNIVNIGFEKQFLLGNAVVANEALVLDKYALDFGIGLFRYSFGAAIGIFKSLVSIVLLLAANAAAGKISDARLF